MKKFLQDFKAFALKGNVVDMAVGVIIGGAFGAIVTSLINDIIMPLLGLLIKVDFTSWGKVLGDNPENLAPGAAAEAGLTVLYYGKFISAGEGEGSQEEGRSARRGTQEAASLPVLQDGNRGRRNPLPALHERAAAGRISKVKRTGASASVFFCTAKCVRKSAVL